ncbi:hypothetical protein [Streptosporangium carneum]|uniref:hypothetical protein n=1 Tax=Streptosporangium carneum TaxID=47481 RepID=UPI0022F2EA2B|nr:hypothetical protein [Streptosporangium carneum]
MRSGSVIAQGTSAEMMTAEMLNTAYDRDGRRLDGGAEHPAAKTWNVTMTTYSNALRNHLCERKWGASAKIAKTISRILLSQRRR